MQQVMGRRLPVVVVGAGMAGLAAARFLVEAGHEVIVLESSPETGGKLRRVSVAGVLVDVGAEAMLNRRPEGVDLARSLGLEIAHPRIVSSRIWTRGGMRPLPRSLMGVPLDLDALAASGVLTEQGLDLVRRERSLPPTLVGGDISVGELVAARFGDEVVDRLVEPLLGGVYAGQARLLSARAAVPQLVTMAERGSLLAQASTVPTTYDLPVFAGIPGGMGQLTEALAAGLRVRTSSTVREITRAAHGFVVTVGPTTAPERIEASGVLLATPAAPTARLLGGLAPTAAEEVAQIDYASVAVVTLAFGRDEVAVLEEMRSSGFLVPPIDGRRIKASTFSFAKWEWVRQAGADQDVVHLRTSLGRHGEATALQATDDELVAWSLRDLESATGFRARPVDSHVQRWGGGLPQYAVGHLDRVARVRSRLPAGIAVAGAAYDGVGIPAVIASARLAVDRIRADQTQPPTSN